MFIFILRAPGPGLHHKLEAGGIIQGQHRHQQLKRD